MKNSISSESIYNNYFWLLSLSAVIAIFTGKYVLSTVFFPLVIFIRAYSVGSIKIKHFVDVIYILLITSIILSWAINQFENKSTIILLYILSNGAFMSAYFIGRDQSRENVYAIFEYSLLPITVVNILGIALYFIQPDWYVDITNKNQFVEGLEAARLRSIFSSPYVCSYSSFFAILYILLVKKKKQHFSNNISQTKKTYSVSTKIVNLCLITSFLALILCMQRCPIGGAILAIVAFSIISINKNNYHKMIAIYAISLVILIITLHLLLQQMDLDSTDFLYEKFEILFDKEDNFFEERRDLFTIEESTFGDGAGRHAHFAMKFWNRCISDNEYGKLEQETGTVGFVLQLSIIVVSLIKSLLNWKNLTFELCVLIFLLFSMSGADPLSFYELHSFFYWFVIGVVVSYKKVKFKHE